MKRIAINGYGRIGRNTLRAFFEKPELASQIEIVAINDLGDVPILAHLTEFDSVHGRFMHAVEHDDQHLIINGKRIRVLSERNPELLPWKELGVDVVFECTGLFTTREQARKHIAAGADKVIVSAPGKDMDATIVYGINDHVLEASDRIISNASCTTNCLAPLVRPLEKALGIRSGFMTTIHAYTNDQQLSDVYHSDVYRARAATQSMIPTKTGAAAAIGQVIPSMQGKLDGMAVRIPTINVSVVDLTFVAERNTSVEEVNQIVAEAARGELSEILSTTSKPLVSIDFNHTPFSSNFDASQTNVNGNLVKVMSWYDNEWGFSNRMLDTCLALINAADKRRAA